MIKSLLRITLQQANNFYNPILQAIKVTSNFMVSSRITSGIYLQNNRVRFNFSLEEKVHNYIKNIESLGLNQHLSYFHQFLESPKQVQTDSAYWVLMTNKILPALNEISNNQKAKMLQRLSIYKMQCRLKNQLQKDLDDVGKLHIKGLHQILRSLSVQRQFDSKRQQKYYKIYERFFEIFQFFKNKEFKKMNQSQKMKYLQQFKLSFLSQEKQQKAKIYKQSENNQNFQINKFLYIKLCRQFYKIKLKNTQYYWLNYWFFTSPFTGKQGQKNLDSLSLLSKKIIFHYYYTLKKHIIKDNLNMINQFPIRMIQNIMQEQKQNIQLKNQNGHAFYFYYEKVLNFITQLKSIESDILSQQQKQNYEDLLKRSIQYSRRIFDQIYNERQSLLRNQQKYCVTLFGVIGQLLNNHATVQIYKNILQFLVVELQKSELLKAHEIAKNLHAIHTKKLSDEDRRTLLHVQKQMWDWLWKKYSYATLPMKDKAYIKKLVLFSQQNDPEQFKVQVPGNVKLIQQRNLNQRKR